jgi:pyridinium-3,5-biscarboxylic acid mononucleotide synthase
MTPAELHAILEEVREGRTDTAQAYDQLLGAFRDQPFEDLGFAKVDHHRSMRQGFAEVILGLGKTPSQIASIAAGIVGRGQPLLVTRAGEPAWRAVQEVLP